MRVRRHPTNLRRMLASRLKRVAASKPLLIASLVETYRLCGKPTCRCTAGFKHRAYQLPTACLLERRRLVRLRPNPAIGQGLPLRLRAHLQRRRLPAVWADFQSLLPLCPNHRLEHTTPEGVRQVIVGSTSCPTRTIRDEPGRSTPSCVRKPSMSKPPPSPGSPVST